MAYQIYIVEDHPEMLRTYELFLASADNLEVVGTAETAEAALHSCEMGQAHVALIDVALPGMSGIELVHKLQQLYPKLPCLMVSGHSEALYAGAAYEAGARGYIMKGAPFEMLEAINCVANGDLFFSDRVRRRLAL